MSQKFHLYPPWESRIVMWRHNKSHSPPLKMSRKKTLAMELKESLKDLVFNKSELKKMQVSPIRISGCSVVP